MPDDKMKFANVAGSPTVDKCKKGSDLRIIMKQYKDAPVRATLWP